MDAAFEAAVEKSKTLPSSVSQDDMLLLYKWFKQVTVGDCNTECPGMFDFKGKAKWNAWNSAKGTSKADAQKNYCDLVNKLAI